MSRPIFTPRDRWLAVVGLVANLLGLIAASTASPGSAVKGLMMVVLGLILGMVGTDVTSGTYRFTLGFVELTDGISLVAMAMGLFGIAEVLANLTRPEVKMPTGKLFGIRHLLPTRKEARQAVKPAVRGALIGSWVGALPGTGPAIAAPTAASSGSSAGCLAALHISGVGVEVGGKAGDFAGAVGQLTRGAAKTSRDCSDWHAACRASCAHGTRSELTYMCESLGRDGPREGERPTRHRVSSRDPRVGK